MATKDGASKKTALAEYEGADREGGIRGMKIAEGDAIVGCVLTNGSNEVILISHQGQAVRFFEGAAAGDEAPDDAEATPPAEGAADTEVAGPKLGLRPQGRFTGGVTGMRFKKQGDYLQTLEVCNPEARLLVAREDGAGKRTPFGDYRLTPPGRTAAIAIDLPPNASVPLPRPPPAPHTPP